MDKIGYEYENNTNYLTILAGEEKENSYQLKMLVHNTIPGLLDMSIRSMNNRRYYYYNITSKKPLIKLYELGKIQWEDVILICKSLDRVTKGVDTYLLDISSVMILPEHMYINVAQKEISYVYNPDSTKDFNEMLKELFEFILEHYEHGKDKEHQMRVYEIYQKIVDGDYQYEHFLDLTKEEKENNIIYFTPDKQEHISLEEVAEEMVTSEAEQMTKQWLPAIYTGKGLSVLCILYAAAALLFPESMWFSVSAPICILMIFTGSAALIQLHKYQKKYRQMGQIVEVTENKVYSFTPKEHCNMESEYSEPEETQEQELGNTVLLSDYLKRKAPEKLTLALQNRKELDGFYENTIAIDTYPCVIGNLGAYCNVVIQSELISRIHACIYKEQDMYYLEDMNSTNGTFWNGERLLPKNRHVFGAGDTIQFANLMYTVEKN